MSDSKRTRITDFVIPSELPEDLPAGDMPGDKILITPELIKKSEIIFPVLLKWLETTKWFDNPRKLVLSIFGGSGVGKSEIAAILAYYLKVNDYYSYILSGDNYPYHDNHYNNVERLRCYRQGGLSELVKTGLYDQQVRSILEKLQKTEKDFDHTLVNEYPFLATYQKGGRKGLRAFLGSEQEMEYSAINRITTAFKNGEKSALLKRLRLHSDKVWYQEVNFSDIDILMIEWVHGNSPHLENIDYRIFLNSTPQETWAHRRDRKRDDYVDDDYATNILGIEDAQTRENLANVDLILTKQGEIIDYRQYLKIMEEAGYQDNW